MIHPDHLPPIALSVRQPWAWAIIAGHKPVENRSAVSIRMGRMDRGVIAIHAAQGMTRAEYDEAAEFMASCGVTCPRPDDLVRGAIIGAAHVIDIVASHPSPWFFGPRALVLTHAQPTDPIPASGQLGYFEWQSGGTIAPALPWMLSWPDGPRRQAAPARKLGLFDGEGGQ